MGLTEKSATTKLFIQYVNNRHDFKGMYDFRGNFLYDDFFRKTHARLYTADFKKFGPVKSFLTGGTLGRPDNQSDNFHQRQSPCTFLN